MTDEALQRVERRDRGGRVRTSGVRRRSGGAVERLQRIDAAAVGTIARSRLPAEQQRARWLQLLLQSADETGVPDDPEFRSAFVAYLEWGTRLAVINSQPGADVGGEGPMPSWSWGEVKGPYVKS